MNGIIQSVAGGALLTIVIIWYFLRFRIEPKILGSIFDSVGNHKENEEHRVGGSICPTGIEGVAIYTPLKKNIGQTGNPYFPIYI